jgi:AcrR family transcriptional regulator
MSRRPYRQTARAEAAEATRRRIAEAFLACARDRWFDEITLEEVARRAGVTVRTVIRQYGGKDGLVAGVTQYVGPRFNAERRVTPGDLEAAIERLFENYELEGDGTVRRLAEESRYPVLVPAVQAGRVGHRAVAAANFAPWLDRLDEPARSRTLDELVIVTDVYTWKLLRRDMGRSVAEAKATILDLVRAVLTPRA